jgi:hypothetical protein
MGYSTTTAAHPSTFMENIIHYFCEFSLEFHIVRFKAKKLLNLIIKII